MIIEFTIPIQPIGKGRPRVAMIAGHAVAYTPTKTRQWEQDVRLLASKYMPQYNLECPLRVDILAVLPRPKRLMRHRDPDELCWAPTKPDKDNIEKAVLDALSGFWRDDAQVVCGNVVKAYTEKLGKPRVQVRITDEIGWPEAAWAATGAKELCRVWLDMQTVSPAATVQADLLAETPGEGVDG